MADFEGEDILSDEELAQINARACYSGHHVHQPLSNIAVYKMPKGVCLTTIN